jgi:hypothetical protein
MHRLWYWICTSTVSLPILVIELVKVFGRSCSVSAALRLARLFANHPACCRS